MLSTKVWHGITASMKNNRRVPQPKPTVEYLGILVHDPVEYVADSLQECLSYSLLVRELHQTGNSDHKCGFNARILGRMTGS